MNSTKHIIVAVVAAAVSIVFATGRALAVDAPERAYISLAAADRSALPSDPPLLLAER